MAGAAHQLDALSGRAARARPRRSGMLTDMLSGPVATIDLAALEHNLERVRAHLPGRTAVLAAVKADAYGHGAVPVARHLEGRGVAWFGVATPEEALALRDGGVTSRILVFGPVHHRGALARLLDAGVALTVADEDSLEALRAARAGVIARVHLKVDSGMGRLGLPWRRAAELARRVDGDAGMVLEGVWTHFARSDEASRDATEAQIDAFGRALAALARDGITPALRHAANSAAVFAYPDAHLDLVRPGIALYGYHSSDVVAALEPGLRPAMRLQAPVTFVKRVPAGTPVSYGGQWRAERDTTVATLRIGYGDGYPRRLSGQGTVHLLGATLPVAGRVCMDQIMVDAGDLEVRPGDVATVWGPPAPDAEILGRRAGTVAYELLTRVSPRVARRYLGQEPS